MIKNAIEYELIYSKIVIYAENQKHQKINIMNNYNLYRQKINFDKTFF